MALSEARKAYKRKWYHDNREAVLARTKANRVLVVARINEWKSQGCAVCGYNRSSAAIDAHHLRDKKYDIHKMTAGNRSIAFLNKELEKCIPLCANCHREYHAGVIEL